MKKLPIYAALVLLAGCLSPAPKSPVCWTIDPDTELMCSSVAVAAPFDGVRFAVLRPDGSVAFDAFNVFAARPAALIRDAVPLQAAAPELMVRKLALDCRKEYTRLALVELELRRNGRSLGRASASVPTDDGDYTKAFSAAFSQAAYKLNLEQKH